MFPTFVFAPEIFIDNTVGYGLINGVIVHSYELDGSVVTLVAYRQMELVRHDDHWDIISYFGMGRERIVSSVGRAVTVATGGIDALTVTEVNDPWLYDAFQALADTMMFSVADEVFSTAPSIGYDYPVITGRTSPRTLMANPVTPVAAIEAAATSPEPAMASAKPRSLMEAIKARDLELIIMMITLMLMEFWNGIDNAAFETAHAIQDCPDPEHCYAHGFYRHHHTLI